MFLAWLQPGLLYFSDVIKSGKIPVGVGIGTNVYASVNFRPPARPSENRIASRFGRRGESQILYPSLTSKTALVFEIRGTFPRGGGMAPRVCAGRRPAREAP